MQITIVFLKNIFPLQTLTNKTPVLHKHSLDEKTLDTPELQQDDCWYFLPYIHPNDHRFCVCLYKKKCLGASHPWLHPGLPGGLQFLPEPQLQSFLASPKTDGPIFFLHYPLVSVAKHLPLSSTGRGQRNSQFLLLKWASSHYRDRINQF